MIYGSFIHSVTILLFLWVLMKKGTASALWNIRDVCLLVRENSWKLCGYYQEAGVRIPAANVVGLIKGD